MSALNYQTYYIESQDATPKSIKSTVIKTSIIVTILLLVANIAHAKDSCEDPDKLDECNAKIERKKDDYESASKKLSELRQKKDELSQKITELASQLNTTQADLDNLSNEIKDLEAELEVINQNLTDRKTALAKKTSLRNKVLRDYSKRGVLTDLEMIFGATQKNSLNNFQYATFDEMFDKVVNDDMLNWMELLNSEITSFEADKQEAQALKTELTAAQNELLAVKTQLAAAQSNAQNEQSNVEEQQKDTEKELANLEEEIAKLTAKQQSIISQKQGDSIVSGYEAAEYKLPEPPFKPAFAAMSYGAYTHYNGMSQYGAKGRAADGQDYKEILKYYYKTDVVKKDGFPSKISVQGYGDLDFQYYLYGIAEMPSDWPMEALKAQAVAARTYAYRTGKPICTTQSCQVFLKSKADNPPDRWKEAVDETKGKILENASTSQYSSTTGGYINNIGWDKDGGSWPGDAYEKKAKSPWFYKAWYTKSYNDGSDKCGRDTPWLKEKELADILNAWVVWRKGSSDEKDHISPVTTSCWGGDPYSIDDMAAKADKYGNKYEEIHSVSVDISNNGYTSKIHFKTNNGTVSIDGGEFKTVFNLRAPAYISLRSRLFDIELED